PSVSAGKRRRRGWCWMAWRPTDALPVDPVGCLHEERVLGMQVEEVTEVAAHRPWPFGAVALLPPLRPDEEQSGAGSVLPAQHGGRVERLLVEPVGGSRVRLVTIVKGGSVGIGELAHI